MANKVVLFYANEERGIFVRGESFLGSMEIRSGDVTAVSPERLKIDQRLLKTRDKWHV